MSSCMDHEETPELCLAPVGGGSESWVPVPGAPGYLVSDRCRLLSTDRRNVRGARRVGRIMRQQRNEKGYLVVTLAVGGRQVRRKVHQLVAAAFIGPCPPGMEVRHLNGDPSDNRPVNLAYGTHSQNQLDSVRHGTHPATRRTHCPLGHLLAAPNLVPAEVRRGYRKCLACSRAQSRTRHHPELDLDVVAADYYRKIMGDEKDIGRAGVAPTFD